MVLLFPISLPEWVIAVYSLFDSDINQAYSWKLNAWHDWRAFLLCTPSSFRWIRKIAMVIFENNLHVLHDPFPNSTWQIIVHLRAWRCNVAVMKRNASLTELGFLLIKAGLLDASVHLIGGWNFADSLALCGKRGLVTVDGKIRRSPFRVLLLRRL